MSMSEWYEKRNAEIDKRYNDAQYAESRSVDFFICRANEREYGRFDTDHTGLRRQARMQSYFYMPDGPKPDAQAYEEWQAISESLYEDGIEQ